MVQFNKTYKDYEIATTLVTKVSWTNNITTTKELYESLRYQESREKAYCYFDLKYNGDYEIENFNKLIEKWIKLKI